MGDIVNLKNVRKAKERADHDKQAEENRQKFGRRKVDKQLDELQKQLREKNLDGHKIE